MAYGAVRYSSGMDKNKERAGGKERQGRESPECKAMFGRNVRPPVRSCNLAGNSPENCLTDGGRARGSREKVRWIWWEVDGWRTRKVAQVIADHFSCFCNFMLCAHVRIGRCGCMRCICSRYTILKCRCFPSTFRVEMMINWLFSHPDKLTCS